MRHKVFLNGISLAQVDTSTERGGSTKNCANNGKRDMSKIAFGMVKWQCFEDSFGPEAQEGRACCLSS